MYSHVQRHRRLLAVIGVAAAMVAAASLLGGPGDDARVTLTGPGDAGDLRTGGATEPSVADRGPAPPEAPSEGVPGDPGDPGDPGAVPPPSPPSTTSTTAATADDPAPQSDHTIDLAGASAPVAAPAGVAPGPYLLTAAVSSGSGRVQITADGQRVGEFRVGEAVRELTVALHVDGPASTIGVVPIDDGTARVQHLRLAPTSPGFTTRGAEILGPSGHPFVPLGVNRTGLNSSADPTNLHRADFEAMRSWGVNTVRLKLGQHLWLEGFCDHDPGYRAAVDDAVGHITDLGMVAYLDLAWTTADDTCGEPGLRAMPDRHSLVFWRQVATRYRDNPLVAFGIFNEPHGVRRDQWRDGGPITEPDGLLSVRRWQAVGMQQLYDTVRETGARNIVYVSGTDYSHDLRAALTHPIDGYGIVYGAHMYCDGCKVLPPLVGRGVEPVVGHYPVAVTEFGTTFADPTFNARVIDWATARGLGWMAFMWADRQHGAFGLLESWETYEPSPGGRPVREALLAAA